MLDEIHLFGAREREGVGWPDKRRGRNAGLVEWCQCWKVFLGNWSPVVSRQQGQVLVHNIVLYPDKNSWCNTTPITQVVAYTGYNSIEIENNVCVGGCFSYSIPHTSPSSPGEVIKPYCDSCQPSRVTWKHVNLVGPGDGTDLFEMPIRVQIIHNCSCSTCGGGNDFGDSSISSLSGDVNTGRKSSLLDVQQLIDFMLEREKEGKSGLSNSTGINEPEMNKRLLILLNQFSGDSEGNNRNTGSLPKPLDSENSSKDDKLDLGVLKELLKQVEGSDHRVNQATLGEFVKNVEDREHIKVNIDKLRHVLQKLDKNDTNVKSSRTVPSALPHRHHQHSHHGHGHHTTAHLTEHPIDNLQTEDISSVHRKQVSFQNNDDSSVSHSRDRFSIPSSLVATIRDEDLDATLDVPDHHFKSAIAGTEISYNENNVVLSHVSNDHSDKD
uniref:CTCK domain-containing protein n=1 Tax=Timema bartmani TaxID=61472 RepID=A0A7R9I430_9NEOP|nr:unnamed protein product [Timema bartmani]